MFDATFLAPSSPLSVASALLSLGAFALFAYVWRECGRRGRRSRLSSLAGGSLRPKRADGVWRAAGVWQATGVWRTLLVAGFVLGLWGIPVVTEARSFASPHIQPPSGTAPDAAGTTRSEAGAARSEAGTAVSFGPIATPARTTTTALRLPFWLRTAHAEETPDGRILEGSLRDTLQIPWLFLLTVLFYRVFGNRRSPGLATVPSSRERSWAEPEASAPKRREAATARGLVGPILFAALGLGLLLGPSPRSVVASGCGGTDGPLCYIYTKCKRILIIKKCTTEYAYYPDFV